MNNYISHPAVRAVSGVFGIALIGGSKSNPVPLPTYRGPSGEIWVAGKKGQEYGIEVIVPDSGRHGALITVDGLNIVNGQRSTGDLLRETFWVLTPPTEPGANFLPGWKRPGNETAARFVFTDENDSYVGQMGRGVENVGVIGARFAYEQVYRPVYRADSLRRGGGALEAFGATKGLGTGYGNETSFKTSTTHFTVDQSRGFPTAIIRYATERALKKAGYILIDTSGVSTSPNPFPGSVSGGCEAPPNWKGGRRRSAVLK